MIEYMEKYILCLFFPGKIMYVINDQNIYHLIEVNKIILIVILN